MPGPREDVEDRAGLDDPAAGAAPGEFRDPDLQVLYDRLVTRGLSTMEEALRVGVLNEETDSMCVLYVRADGGYGLLEPE